MVFIETPTKSCNGAERTIGAKTSSLKHRLKNTIGARIRFGLFGWSSTNTFLI